MTSPDSGLYYYLSAACHDTLVSFLLQFDRPRFSQMDCAVCTTQTSSLDGHVRKSHVVSIFLYLAYLRIEHRMHIGHATELMALHSYRISKGKLDIGTVTMRHSEQCRLDKYIT